MYRNSSEMYSEADMLVSVSTKQNAFGDLLDWLREERGLSYRKIAIRSGGAISHSTLGNLKGAKHPNPELDTIKALAKATGLPARSILDAFIGKNPTDLDIQTDTLREMIITYEKLPESKRKELKLMVNSLAKAILAVQDD